MKQRQYISKFYKFYTQQVEIHNYYNYDKSKYLVKDCKKP